MRRIPTRFHRALSTTWSTIRASRCATALVVFLHVLGLSSADAQTSLNLSLDLVPLGIATHNLVPDSPSLDARPLFEAGVQYAQNHHIPVLTVDRGSYYFLTPASGTTDRYTDLFQISDLTIDLAGSMIYFTDPFLQGFSLTECQRVTLTNFQTDFINPPYTHVQLTSVDAIGRRFFYRTLPGWVDPVTFNGVAGPYGPPTLWAVVFRNGAIVPGTSRMHVVNPIGSGVFQLLQDGTPWTQTATLSTLQPGDTLVVTERDGGGPPISVFRGDAIVLSNIAVYGSNTWAVDVESTTNSIADHIRVMPRPVTGLVGSNADGIHFSSARQNNHIRNSYVTRTIDDAIAIDSLAIGTVLSQAGPRQLHVSRRLYYRFPDGTPLNFVDVTTTGEVTGATIVSQDPPDTLFPTRDGEVDLTFDQDLPSLAAGSEVVFGNADLRGSGSSIEDNIVDDLLFGRGIWISGNEVVTVQRNSIGHTSNGGIVLSQDTKAFPGPPAHDIVVQSNALAGSLGPMASGTGTQTAVGAIIVESTDNLFHFGQMASNSNVSILSNYVADSGRAGIWVGELDGGTIQDNLIIRWNQHPELPVWGLDAADLTLVQPDFSQPLAVHFSDNVTLTNNTAQLNSVTTGAVNLGLSSVKLDGESASDAVSVHSNVTGLSWLASSDASWLTVTSDAGTGDGTIHYVVSANTTGRPRTGSLTVAGVVFLVVQNSLATDGDFDGDGRSDVTIYRRSSHTWYVLLSSTNFTTYATYVWGVAGDVPVRGDFDGDGKTDVAIYRPSTGAWYILLSSSGYTAYVNYLWGAPSDMPEPGDYDGDGKTDIAAYRPSTGTWFVLLSSTGYATYVSHVWGLTGDLPVPADYDGDGHTDIAVYRPSNGWWYALQSSTNSTTYLGFQWGLGGDVPVAADYDGDGKVDPAVYRPSNGGWYFLRSSTSYTTYGAYLWGVAGDVPVPADYDGDGRADIAVYRPSAGLWYILQSSTSYSMYVSYPWGLAGDVPLLRRP
jgi:hypothetical protein